MKCLIAYFLYFLVACSISYTYLSLSSKPYKERFVKNQRERGPRALQTPTLINASTPNVASLVRPSSIRATTVARSKNSGFSFPPVYFITLKNDPVRLKHVQKVIKANPYLKAKIWSASTTVEIEEKKLDKYLNANSYLKVRRGALGCAISHIRVLEHVVENKLEEVIVFEDDVVLSPDFEVLYKEFRENLPRDGTFAPFLHHNSMKNLRGLSKFTLSGNKFVLKSYSPYGTVGYLITLKGAIKVLPTLSPVWYPIDEMYRSATKSGTLTSYMPAHDLIVMPYKMKSNIWGTKKRPEGVKKRLKGAKSEICKRYPNFWKDKELKRKFTDLLFYADKIFRSASIEYCISFGTALGFRRMKQLTPWDDDVDLLIRRSNSSSGRLLIKPPYCTEKFWGGWKIFRCDSRNAGKWPWKYPFIDIFDNTDVEGRYKNSGRYEVVFPSVDITFEGMKLKGPKNIDKHLSYYGSNYLEDCVAPHWDHANEKTRGKWLKHKCKDVMKLCFDTEEWNTNNSKDDGATVIISGKAIHYKFPKKMQKISTGIVVGVLSYDAKKRQLIRNFYKDETIYFIVGKKDGKFNMDEFNKYKDMILIDKEESYMGEDTILPYKTQVFFHAVHSMVKTYQYALKIDDDSLVQFEALRKELRRAKPDYWGRVWHNAGVIRDPKSKWFVSKSAYSPDRYPDYCSGAGYALSKEANACIVGKLPTLRFMPREDVATGILAQQCGIKAVSSMKVKPVKSYNGDDYIIRHYVNLEQQLKQQEPDSDWCKTHDVLPNGAFCSKKYAGIDTALAKAIVEIIPKGSTITDLGAGGGWYTYYFNKNGLKSFAYDASPVRPKNVKFIDLTETVKIPNRDWTLCLEVGEHLPKKFETTFLKNVAQTSGVVLSWAVPGQGGNNHVNLQKNSYVINKMKEYGYTYQEQDSAKLRKASTFGWFKNTVMVFRRKFLKHQFIGGQGNQIWQYLAMKGIAEKNGFRLCGDMPNKISIMEVEPYAVCPKGQYQIVKETNLNLLTVPDKNTEILGYLQYTQYFGDLTIENFKIKEQHIQNAKNILLQCDEWIGLHVRMFPKKSQRFKIRSCFCVQ